MARKRLPPELLYELINGVRAEKGWFDIFTSSPILQYFFTPRIVKWAEIGLINLFKHVQRRSELSPGNECIILGAHLDQILLLEGAYHQFLATSHGISLLEVADFNQDVDKFILSLTRLLIPIGTSLGAHCQKNFQIAPGLGCYISPTHIQQIIEAESAYSVFRRTSYGKSLLEVTNSDVGYFLDVLNQLFIPIEAKKNEEPMRQPHQHVSIGDMASSSKHSPFVPSRIQSTSASVLRQPQKHVSIGDMASSSKHSPFVPPRIQSTSASVLRQPSVPQHSASVLRQPSVPQHSASVLRQPSVPQHSASMLRQPSVPQHAVMRASPVSVRPPAVPPHRASSVFVRPPSVRSHTHSDFRFFRPPSVPTHTHSGFRFFRPPSVPSHGIIRASTVSVHPPSVPPHGIMRASSVFMPHAIIPPSFAEEDHYESIDPPSPVAVRKASQKPPKTKPPPWKFWKYFNRSLKN